MQIRAEAVLGLGEYGFHYDWYQLLWLFLIYSVLGWCAGVASAAVKRKKFINTGVLNLPLCPVYGIAAAGYSIFLNELKDEPVFLFLGGMVITSFLMVITGVVLEHIFHRKWWDYSGHRFGFGQYITAPLLICYGAETIFVLWVGNPLILNIVGLIPRSVGNIAVLGMTAFVLIDLSGVLAVVWKWRRHIERVAELTDNMQMLSETFGNAITNAIRRRLERSYSNLETKKILEEKAREREQTQEKFAEGCGFYKLFALFLIGAFLGDIVEVVFCRITMGWWMSRSSVVYGPFSIVWGLGCSMLTAFLYRYRDKSDGAIFLYGTVVGGTYEYLCSVFTELVFGTVFWTYKHIPFNLGGRINLLFCFFWGIVAVVWLKFVYPFLSKMIEKIPKKIGRVLTWVLLVFMIFDAAVSSLALGRYSQRQRGVEAETQLEQMLDEHFPDERMAKIYPKARLVRK